MSVGSTTPSGGVPETVSPRLRLARLARDTALAVPGVVRMDAGPDGVFTVVSGRERVDGVLCVATAEDGFDLSLRLVCGLVPLPALGERVRATVRARAAAAGLEAVSVAVHVSEIATPTEA